MRCGLRRTPLRVRLTVLAGVLLLGAGGCDGDRGPGTVRLRVAGEVPLGAVVVELVGKGIEGVDPIPDGWVEGAPVQEGTGNRAYRIVAVLQEPGMVDVGVRMADLDDPLPRVTVVEAADGFDRLLTAPGSVTAVLRR